MSTEHAVQLCFIRGRGEPSSLEAELTAELDSLLGGLGTWFAEYKTTEEAELLAVEAKGRDRFATEQEALLYLEACGSERFWSWLQGYRIRVEPSGGCACCGA